MFIKQKNPRAREYNLNQQPSPDLNIPEFPSTEGQAIGFRKVKKNHQNQNEDFQMQNLKRLERDKRERNINELRNKLSVLSKEYIEIKDKFTKDLNEKSKKIQELDQKRQNLEKTSKQPIQKIRQDNIAILEEHRTLEDEREELEQSIAISLQEIQKMKKNQNDIHLQIESMPHKKQIKSLYEYMITLENETSEKLIKLKKFEEHTQQELNETKERIEGLSLDVEDLHNENVASYDKAKKLDKELFELQIEDMKLNVAIQISETMVPLAYLEVQIKKEENASAKAKESTKRKLEDAIKAESERLARMKAELADQNTVVRKCGDLIEKNERIMQQCQEGFAAELQKIKDRNKEEELKLQEELSREIKRELQENRSSFIASTPRAKRK